MAPFSGDIKRILPTVYRLAVKRNHIVHGFISEYVEKTKTVVFHNSKSIRATALLRDRRSD
jgi:hypothetical protein